MIYEAIDSLILGVVAFLALILLVMGAQFVKALLEGKISVLDLVNGEDGRLSESKCWLHVGKGMAVYVMIKDAADGHPTMEMQALMLCILVAHKFFEKLLVMKFGNGSAPAKAVKS